MKTKLITALRLAVNAIEKRTVSHDWNRLCQCNCGMLACALFGYTPSQLDARLPEGKYTWQMLVQEHCPITGIPRRKIFRDLYAAGLTGADIVNLEYLRDPRVLTRMGYPRTATVQPKRKWYQLRRPEAVTTTVIPNHVAVDAVVAYMRAWADLLVEEGALDVPEPERACAVEA